MNHNDASVRDEESLTPHNAVPLDDINTETGEFTPADAALAEMLTAPAPNSIAVAVRELLPPFNFDREDEPLLHDQFDEMECDEKVTIK